MYDLSNGCVASDLEWSRFQGHSVIFKPIDALSVLCVYMTRDLLAIAKFLSIWRMEFLHPAMWHDHDIDLIRWLQPAMWHVALESWQWIHQVAAPCNVIHGSGMTCHWIRPNVRHIGILHLVSISTHHRSRYIILIIIIINIFVKRHRQSYRGAGNESIRRR